MRIAFHTLGEGPAVVMLFTCHVNHLALRWRVPLHRGAIEYVARYFTVVNLDFRGAGLSERGVSRLTPQTFHDDLDTVLTALGVERVALMAIGLATLVACHVAVRPPQRVASLVPSRAARRR